MWTTPTPPAELNGINGFRLFPTDELFTAPAQGWVGTVADGQGLALTYGWQHPTDGPQHGSMLVGSADDEGVVQIAWIDSWHQKPGLMILKGAVSDCGCTASVEYFEHFTWQIEIAASDTEFALTMRNIVADDAPRSPETEGMPTGPYDVMVLRLG